MKLCGHVKATKRESRARLELRCVKALGHKSRDHLHVWFVKSGRMTVDTEAL